MKQLQNNFTTPEQSKRLLELGVPADSADLFFASFEQGDKSQSHLLYGGYLYSKRVPIGYEKLYLPCWSAGRLIEIIAECYQVDMPFLYFVRGGMMESLINTFMDLRGEIDFSKLED